MLIDVAKGTELKTDQARSRATLAMTHSAYLIHEAVSAHLVSEDEKPSTEHCMLYHSYRQELVRSPSNYRSMLRNMKAACGVISSTWDGIEPPDNFDPDRATHRN
jgi:hypothetical protein